MSNCKEITQDIPRHVSLPRSAPPGSEKNKFGLNYTREAGPSGELEDAFYGEVAAFREIQHERPWHRMAVEYAIQGLSITEICGIMNRSHQCVADVLRQPWARERLIKRAKMSTMDKIKDWLEEECMPSLEVIKAVRDNPAARSADRKAAAEYITDRFIGKAVQPVCQTETKPSDLTKDEIEQRVARLAEGMETT